MMVCPPAPEEEQDDLLHDEYIHRRLLLLEEKVYRGEMTAGIGKATRREAARGGSHERY